MVKYATARVRRASVLAFEEPLKRDLIRKQAKPYVRTPYCRKLFEGRYPADGVEYSEALQHYIPTGWTTPRIFPGYSTNLNFSLENSDTVEPPFVQEVPSSPLAPSDLSAFPPGEEYERTAQDNIALARCISHWLYRRVMGQEIWKVDDSKDWSQGFQQEVVRIIEDAQLPTAVILLAVAYIDRLCAGETPLVRPTELISSHQIVVLGRIFTIGLMFSAKYMLEQEYSIKIWCALSRMKSKEVNETEVAGLNVLGWSLYMSTETWVATLTSLRDDPILSFDRAHTDFSQLVTMVLSEADYMFGSQPESSSTGIPAKTPVAANVDEHKRQQFRRSIFVRLGRRPSAITSRIGIAPSILAMPSQGRQQTRKYQRLPRLSSAQDSKDPSTSLFLADSETAEVTLPVPIRPPPPPPLGPLPFLSAMSDSIASYAGMMLGGAMDLNDNSVIAQLEFELAILSAQQNLMI